MAKVIIAGAGISGLSLAYLLDIRSPSLEVLVLESEARPGGKIWTDRAEGFLCESGVNGFLDNKPKTLELIGLLSLTPLRSNSSSRNRFIFSDGKLHRLPESPPAFLSSQLLNLTGRLRVALEAAIPKGSGDNDESLADFARRRLGREAYEKLIDPMASGIYAGDPEKLSLKSCFPRINELEMNYGSLIRALIKLQVKARKEGRKGPGPGPGGVLTSFYEGMEVLTQRLKESLGSRVVTGKKVESVDKKGDIFSLKLSDGTVMEADAVVLSTPAHAASKIAKDLDKGISAALEDIIYPSVSVVCLGYKKEQVRHETEGFGFLIPFKEKRKLLGTLWDSSIFPNRAPEGHLLLRSMVGGARASEIAMQPVETLVRTVESELSRIMDIRSDPVFARVYQHEKAIPQYNIGHQNKISTIEKLLVKYKGMYLTGNAYRGIGVNDCIENSYKLTERISKDLKI